MASMRALSPARLISSLPVRGRTAALALAPFIGLLAIGLAYMSGERQIAAAFANVSRAAALSEASRDFRRAVEIMRARARDTVARPNAADVLEFERAYRTAFANFDKISAFDTVADLKDPGEIKATVIGLNAFFAGLVAQQEVLGRDGTQGLRGRLRATTGNVEQLVREQLGASQEVAAAMLASLQAMRRLELQFESSKDEPDVSVKFFAELGRFNRLLEQTEAEGRVKEQISHEVMAYADAFRELMALTRRINGFLAAIDNGTRQVIPEIDRRVAIARENAGAAIAALMESRARITVVVIVVAVLAMLAGVGLSSLIGLGINAQNVRFDAALNNMSQGLLMLDADFRVVVCNRRYREIFGLAPDVPWRGASMLEVFQCIMAAGHHADLTAERLYDDFTRRLRADGSARFLPELSNGRTILILHRPMANGGWVGTYEDITEKKRAEERVAHLAHHDALTDLPNRVLFREKMEHALKRVGRGERSAILCLDLDHFKSVNDALGHPVGDALLCAVTTRLQAIVRETDEIARLGGDEFAIIQTAIGGAADATGLACRVIETIGEPYDLGGHQIVIGVSIGIALAPEDGIAADQLMKNADMALYRAKADGRGTYRFFEPSMDALMQARHSLELELRKALDAGQFELHYQPLINLVNREVSGFEALLRWRHPVRGLIGPAEFISLTEEIGLIVPIGEWVVQQACREAATWPGNLRVAVNLSPVQFSKSRDLVGTVAFALAAAGLAPGRLELEITESVLLQESDAALATLHRIKSLGVHISMDDFGTGYSSLSYLRSFPFDKIKIDQSFVRDLSRRDDCLAIVRAVTSLGESLGIVTVAEGVETQEQLEALRTEGCTEVQGFFMGAPTSASEVRAVLETLGQRLVA